MYVWQGTAKRAESAAESAQASLQAAEVDLARQREASASLAERLRAAQSKSEASSLKVVHALATAITGHFHPWDACLP